jgi:hypothetical protein
MVRHRLNRQIAHQILPGAFGCDQRSSVQAPEEQPSYSTPLLLAPGMKLKFVNQVIGVSDADVPSTSSPPTKRRKMECTKDSADPPVDIEIISLPTPRSNTIVHSALVIGSKTRFLIRAGGSYKTSGDATQQSIAMKDGEMMSWENVSVHGWVYTVPIDILGGGGGKDMSHRMLRLDFDTWLGIELAFAVTTHAMQGLEDNHIILFLENHFMVDNTVLYTALTRARQSFSCLLQTDQASLQQSHGTTKPVVYLDLLQKVLAKAPSRKVSVLQHIISKLFDASTTSAMDVNAF